MLVSLPKGKKFAESQVGRSSFQKLLEPKPTQRSASTPYRIVLGNIKDKQSCGSGILADGRLADLIRRVATFGMVLMKARLAPDVLLFYCRRSCYPRYNFGIYDEGFLHRSSRTLIMVETMNNLLDWFISVVTERTDDLWYRGRHGLTNLLEEHDRGRLHGLKYLCIESSEYAKVLLNTITWTRVSNEPVFENLEELEISGCLLEELCVGELPPGSLRNLKKLMMGECDRLVKPLLPSKLLHRLESLEELRCSYMRAMKYVFGFEGHEPQHVVLTRLRMISLRSMDSLINVWDGPAPSGIFQSLKIFSLVNCQKLEYLFTSDVARCLLQLEDVLVENCDRLDRIIEASEEIESNKIVLPQLKNLVLKRLPQLTRLSSTSSSTIDIEIECPTLEHLYVSECPQLSISASDFNSSNEVQQDDYQHWDTLRYRIDDVSYRSERLSLMRAMGYAVTRAELRLKVALSFAARE